MSLDLNLVYTILLSVSRFGTTYSSLQRGILQLRVVTGSSDRRSRTLGLGVHSRVLRGYKGLFLGYSDLRVTRGAIGRGLGLFASTTGTMVLRGKFGCATGTSFNGDSFGAQCCSSFALPTKRCGSLVVALNRKGKGG